MAKAKVSTPKDVVERNIALSGEIMRFLIDNPNVFKSLPDDFELIILPDDDPEMRIYNLDLLDVYGSQGKPVVFARVASSRYHLERQPSLYIPLMA